MHECTRTHDASTTMSFRRLKTKANDGPITHTLHINIKKPEEGDELSLKQLISSCPYEYCHWFSDKAEINECGACQWFRWLPKRCSWLQRVRAFVCHRNVNTCEPLAGENTSRLNLWLTLITGLQMLQILLEKNITWGWIRPTSSCQVKPWPPAPGAAGSGYIDPPA